MQQDMSDATRHVGCNKTCQLQQGMSVEAIATSAVTRLALVSVSLGMGMGMYPRLDQSGRLVSAKVDLYDVGQFRIVHRVY